ncbi:MAG: nickel pincer cofactor biosynthesis protein LarC [Anaerolineales bacterium]|nr:nickel pincer cofactor biosynthesis protein LarC [Anaerolineales bacterium]
MKVLYFDLIGGASGDMILGAMVDAGLSIDILKKLLAGLNLNEFDILAKIVDKNGFCATKVDVLVTEQPPERHLKEIKDIIQKSSLPRTVQNRALQIFERIAGAEAAIHNKSVDQVHLHELGGTDTIIDITGALLALEHLEISKIYASPVPMGKGFVKGAHGQIPLPAPATAALLKGIPVYGRDIDAELVTPTGAALLADLVDDFGPAPPMILETIGYGAGGRDLPIPNLLRVLIGEITPAESATLNRLAVLETNLDDLNPEIYPYVIESLFSAGALDVTLSPVQMKKNRPGTQIQVLCEPVEVDAMRSILFQETTTLGIKQIMVDRYALPRTIQEVETPYGKIRVKIAKISPDIKKISPEFEDCRKAAQKHGIPITQIYQETIHSFQE